MFNLILVYSHFIEEFMNDNFSLNERDKKYIWHPFTQVGLEEAPLPIMKGKGALLFDEKGEAYVDAVSSWWVNLHGHAHPYIADKINEYWEHSTSVGYDFDE